MYRHVAESLPLPCYLVSQAAGSCLMTPPIFPPIPLFGFPKPVSLFCLAIGQISFIINQWKEYIITVYRRVISWKDLMSGSGRRISGLGISVDALNSCCVAWVPRSRYSPRERCQKLKNWYHRRSVNRHHGHLTFNSQSSERLGTEALRASEETVPGRNEKARRRVDSTQPNL